jgi:hypothetical protein
MGSGGCLHFPLTLHVKSFEVLGVLADITLLGAAKSTVDEWEVIHG